MGWDRNPCGMLHAHRCQSAPRFLFPQVVHGFDGVVAHFFAGPLAQNGQVDLALARLDQDLQQHRMRQLPLGGACGEHAGDVADVVQPVLASACGRCERYSSSSGR